MSKTVPMSISIIFPLCRQSPDRDRRCPFYEHEGVDKISMLRVFFKTVLLGHRSSGGGSTLSQQLAKNLYPRDEQQVTFIPVVKLKEMFTAHRLENIYSKDDILTLYLNTVSFGENTFGIESAAQNIFQPLLPI